MLAMTAVVLLLSLPVGSSVGQRILGDRETVVRAFVFVQQSVVDGRAYVAAAYADEASNGLHRLAPESNALQDTEKVRLVLRADLEAHVAEYLVRERMSFALTQREKDPDSPLTREKYEVDLHRSFLEDERYACRIARALLESGVSISVPTLCERVTLGTVTVDRIERAVNELRTYLGDPEGWPACGVHATLYARGLLDEDPLLLAHVLEAYQLTAGDPSLSAIVATLAKRGWIVEKVQ